MVGGEVECAFGFVAKVGSREEFEKDKKETKGVSFGSRHVVFDLG